MPIVKTICLLWLAVHVLVLIPFTIAGVYADFQRQFPSIAEEWKTRDLVGAIVMGLFPVGPYVAVFTSGFYRHGFIWPWTRKGAHD